MRICSYPYTFKPRSRTPTLDQVVNDSHWHGTDAKVFGSSRFQDHRVLMMLRRWVSCTSKLTIPGHLRTYLRTLYSPPQDKARLRQKFEPYSNGGRPCPSGLSFVNPTAVCCPIVLFHDADDKLLSCFWAAADPRWASGRPPRKNERRKGVGDFYIQPFQSMYSMPT